MKHILITGGGGFVGKEIARQAIEKGLTVSVFGRNHYPELEQMGAACIKGDIRSLADLESACSGMDTVFHVAALAGIWGDWDDYYSINVQGTKNVLKSCRINTVARLVYTSTPSVVFNRQNLTGEDESLDYPDTFLCHYARTKALAEQEVLAAASDELATCAIRPHLVWGPGDPHLVPRLLERGRAGLLKRVGDGTNLVDISYVDNVAYAHLLAAENLSARKTANGKAYFVSQDEPVNLWGWINELYEKVGVPAITQSVSFSIAYRAGHLLELAYGLARVKKEPRMTRFLAEQLAKSHYFSIENCKRDLGYSPLVNNVEGMERLISWIKENDI